MAERSRIAGLARLDHLGGDEACVGHPPFGIEVQVPLAAEAGEFVSIEVNANDGDAAGALLIFLLESAVEEFVKRRRKLFGIGHDGADGIVALPPVPADGDGADGQGRAAHLPTSNEIETAIAKLHKWQPDDSGAVMMTTSFQKIEVVRRDSGERVLICTVDGHRVLNAVLAPEVAAKLARLLAAA
jgi:hypothetical protein